jgi:hypothetical protein
MPDICAHHGTLPKPDPEAHLGETCSGWMAL